MRVALGSVCRKVLEDIGIFIGSRVVQIHDVKDEQKYNLSPTVMNSNADDSPVRCLDKTPKKKWLLLLTKQKRPAIL